MATKNAKSLGAGFARNPNALKRQGAEDAKRKSHRCLLVV